MANKNSKREIATSEELLQEDTERHLTEIELLSGKIVIVKPLSRKQALRFKGNRKMPRDLFEQRIVAMAMIEPKLTQLQVSAWQELDRADGDLKKITDTIIEISGMRETDSKREQTSNDDL